MKYISVSGLSGFVGQNLLPYLINNGFDIQSIDRQLLLAGNYDLNSESIVHLAGKAHDLNKSSNPNVYYDVNFELTKRLYDKFLKSDAKKFVFISSVKASADSVSGFLTEVDIPVPKTHYGKSKLMAEQYIQSQILPNGKSYYILRPCMIHGPNNKGNLNLLYKFVQNGIPYPLASFENKRSFLSVENLCFIIFTLLTKGSIPSGIYNVADDGALSTNEVVSILYSTINKKPKLWYFPKKLIEIIAKIGDSLKLPLNTERLNKLTENYVVSNQKIKQALGVELPVKINEGLVITANSFKKTV